MTQQEDWAAVLKYMGDGSVQEIKITKVNKGGVRGMLAGIEGFVPYSKIYKVRDGTSAQKYYESLLATPQDLKMKVKVVAVSSLFIASRPLAFCHIVWQQFTAAFGQRCESIFRMKCLHTASCMQE